jgi:hypothetical protein
VLETKNQLVSLALLKNGQSKVYSCLRTLLLGPNLTMSNLYKTRLYSFRAQIQARHRRPMKTYPPPIRLLSPWNELSQRPLWCCLATQQRKVFCVCWNLPVPVALILKSRPQILSVLVALLIGPNNGRCTNVAASYLLSLCGSILMSFKKFFIVGKTSEALSLRRKNIHQITQMVKSWEILESPYTKVLGVSSSKLCLFLITKD